MRSSSSRKTHRVEKLPPVRVIFISNPPLRFAGHEEPRLIYAITGAEKLGSAKTLIHHDRLNKSEAILI
jgi:hypothetical protein